MRTKQPAKRKPCKFYDMGAEGSFEPDPSVYAKSNPSVANHQTPNPSGDTNISSTEPSFQQFLPSETENMTDLTNSEPSVQQLLSSRAADIIIDLTNSDENVPLPPPVGSLMKRGNNGPSSSCFQPQQPPEGLYIQLSSRHIQPSHPLIKDVIEKYSCSQTLLKSVLRCTQSGPKRRGSKINAIDVYDGLEIVTSQNSQSQAGAGNEAHSRSTFHAESSVGTCKRGSKRSTLAASELGNNRQKSTRRNNLGSGPSNLEGPSRAEAEALASAEVRELREQMEAMRSIILDQQKKLADKDGVPPEASQGLPKKS